MLYFIFMTSLGVQSCVLAAHVKMFITFIQFISELEIIAIKFTFHSVIMTLLEPVPNI